MNKLYNGFQCSKCKYIHTKLEDAVTCETQPVEEPLLNIGDTLIDDSYDVEHEVRVSGIYFEGHQVNYRMEWKSPDGDGTWENVYTIYGNEMLGNFRTKLEED